MFICDFQKPWADFDHCRIIMLILPVHRKNKGLSPTDSRVHGQPLTRMAEKLSWWMPLEHAVLDSSVSLKKHKGSFVYTFLSPESEQSYMSTWLEAPESIFTATDCSHLLQGDMSSETHMGFTGMVGVRQQDIAVWKRNSKPAYRFKCTHWSWQCKPSCKSWALTSGNISNKVN